MTDGNQVVVWDAVFKPFGETHSTTGTTSNNQRFPGQYADSETGFNYNYFRDYDPRLGRYVESDPIGMASGDLYQYHYVRNHPLRLIDPLGTTAIVVPIGIGIGELIGEALIGIGLGVAINEGLSNLPDIIKELEEKMKRRRRSV